MEQKEWERCAGGNGGKFQERENATCLGEGEGALAIGMAAIGGADQDHQMLNSAYRPVCFALPYSPPLSPRLFYAFIKRSVAYRWVTDEQPFHLVINIFLVGTQPPVSCAIITLLQYCRVTK